jgi:4-amino-4-deoxy-L-arabinose transferase-like glycosyltransferase
MRLSLKISCKSQPIPYWVILICLVTLVFGIAGHALWTADEPREAEIAREMSMVIKARIMGDDVGGRTDWAVPYLAGKPFVEKPPLYYWLSALMMLTAGRLIGMTVAARAISAICGALTLGVIWLVLREYLGRYRALGAVLILVTTAGFFQAAHWILIDPLLMLLITAAILFLFYGLDRDRRFFLLGAYLAAGLAFLTKGFVAWGLLAIPWTVLLVLYFNKIRRRPFLHLVGILLLIGPGLVWVLSFYEQGGALLWEEWFINNNIGRFLGQTTHSHIRGPFYYLGLVPLLLLPWTPLLIGWVFQRDRLRYGDLKPGARRLLKVAASWALGGLILLSFSGTKRTIYLYPLLPGFACLAAFSLDRIPYWVRVVFHVITSILLVVIISLSFFTADLSGASAEIIWKFNPVVLLCAAVGIFAYICFRNDLLLRGATISAVCYLAASFAIFPLIDLEKNYEPATRRISVLVPETGRSRICGWHIDETTRAVFSYYTGLTLINLRDKLHPEKNLGRLANILNGKDREYDFVVVLLKRNKKFPPEGMPAASFQILAEEKMGKNRRLLLLAGDKE